MKHFFYALTLLALFSFAVPGALAQPEITPNLAAQLAEKDAEEFIPINIRLTSQYDAHTLYQRGSSISHPDARRRYVVQELKEFSAREQEALLAYLEQMQAEGRVKGIQAFWIGNLVHCQATPQVIEELSTRKDLARLDYNKERQVLPLEVDRNNDMIMDVDKTGTTNLAWNVTLVNADQVWDDGITGEEVVVAVLDTGVNYNHLDLAGRMWTHPEYPNHGYNFVNNNHNTMDYQSHGTHCAGTVAGNGTAGTVTGMAPGATIMAIKVLGDTGGGTEAGVWAGIQFAVEHGARVMSLSLGWKHAWSPDRSMWRTTMNNALSAGVIAAVAAGNEGTSSSDMPPSEVRTPGDIPPPWTHPDQTLQGGNSAVVSVGSTTNTDALSSFSSKGPVTWQNVSPFNDYAYNPGMGLIRPDVVAPGTGILSLTHNSNHSYTTKSGTSMATPAVAGIMALMISKNPALTPEDISQILEETALSITLTKSNSFGSGRVDALAAVQATPYMGIQYVSHQLDDSEGSDNGKINAGETIHLDIVLENPTEEDIEDVFLTLRIASPYITLNDSIASIGDFAAGEQRTIEGVFTFEVANNIPGKHEVEFFLFAYQDAEESVWRSRFIETADAPRLQFAGLIVDDSAEGNDNGRLDPGENAILRFVLENAGTMTSEDFLMNIEAPSPFIILGEHTFSGDAIDANDQVYVEFPVSVHGAMTPGTTAAFQVTMESGHYLIEEEFQLRVGMNLEDWSSGGFNQFDWQFGGNAQWYLVTNTVYEGAYAARSGIIGHSSQTTLSVEMEVLTSDSISFYRKVSSENNYDWLEFWIDNTRMGRWSGERDWQRFAYPVEPGMRTFKWVYIKDYIVSAGQDCAWIDMIEFPAVSVTSAFAGFDDEVCGMTPFTLDGFATRYDEVNWTTGGDGTFGNANELNTSYTPGQQDLHRGFAKLSIEATFEGEVLATDSMMLTVLPKPSVNLGGEAILCTNHTLELDAGPGHTSYLWSDDSTGQTFLVDPAHYDEDVDIWVLVTNEYGCATTDTINITFDECLSTFDPVDPGSLSIYPNPATAALTVSFFSEGSQPATIRMISLTGQVMLENQITTTAGQVTKEFNVSGFNPGVYLLQLESQGTTATRRLVIQ
jgi:subtilisin family serine protease